MKTNKKESQNEYFVDLNFITTANVMTARHFVEPKQWESVKEQLLKRLDYIVFTNIYGKKVFVNVRSLLTIELGTQKKPEHIIIPDNVDQKILKQN